MRPYTYIIFLGLVVITEDVIKGPQHCSGKEKIKLLRDLCTVHVPPREDFPEGFDFICKLIFRKKYEMFKCNLVF